MYVWIKKPFLCNLGLDVQIGCLCPGSRRRQWQPTPVLLPGKSHGWRSLVGCSPGVAKSGTPLSDFAFTFHFHALEKEMATHSSILVWRTPGTGEPGGQLSMGSHRVGHDWRNLAAAAAAISWHHHRRRFSSLHRTKQIAYNCYLLERCGLSKERLHICNEGEMHVTSADSC